MKRFRYILFIAFLIVTIALIIVTCMAWGSFIGYITGFLSAITFAVTIFIIPDDSNDNYSGYYFDL